VIVSRQITEKSESYDVNYLKISSERSCIDFHKKLNQNIENIKNSIKNFKNNRNELNTFRVKNNTKKYQEFQELKNNPQKYNNKIQDFDLLNYFDSTDKENKHELSFRKKKNNYLINFTSENIDNQEKLSVIDSHRSTSYCKVKKAEFLKLEYRKISNEK
jgi:hypothetical protein